MLHENHFLLHKMFAESFKQFSNLTALKRVIQFSRSVYEYF